MSSQTMDVDILFKGADIFTMDKNKPFIRNGAIAVVSNKIVAVGAEQEVTPQIASAARTIDCSDLLIMPGMVDGHTHLFQGLGKTLGDGFSLLPWLSKFMMPLSATISSEEAIHAVRLGSLHAALSGTTSIIDNHYAPVDEQTIIAAACAMEQVGVRGAVARGIYGPMVEGSHKMKCDSRLFQYSSQEELDITRACLNEKPAGSLVEIWPTPENVVYLDPDLMIAAHEMAREFDVSWHSHCSESMYEVEIFQSVYNMRPVKWLHENGILDHRTTLAHGIWFDEEEIELLGQAGSTVVHNPISNQFLASGIIKLEPLMKAGVNVTIGTDGTAVAGQDMFEAMKAAQMMQKLRELDPESTSSELVLCMATRNGGRMMKKDLGRLEPGMLADFIAVDLSGLHQQPTTRPACCLTQSTRGSDVKHVVVNGDIIVENGVSTKVDQEKIIADALQASRQLIDRAGIRDLVVDWREPKFH